MGKFFILFLSIAIYFIYFNLESLKSKEINVYLKRASNYHGKIIKNLYAQITNGDDYSKNINYNNEVFYNIYNLYKNNKFIFIYINNKYYCGTDGCGLTVFKLTNKKWIPILSAPITKDADDNYSNIYILDETDFGYRRLLQKDYNVPPYHYCWKDGRYQDDDPTDDREPNWVTPCPNK
jgi:hypothetical protein